MTSARYGIRVLRLFDDYLVDNWNFVKLKNGPHFVTIIFVLEKDAEASVMLKFRELVKTDTRFE